VDPKLTEAAAKIADLEGQLARTAAELAETKTQLDKERKDKAELATGKAKLSGQIQTQARAADKAQAEIARLQAQVIELNSSRSKEGASEQSSSVTGVASAGIVVPPAAPVVESLGGQDAPAPLPSKPLEVNGSNADGAMAAPEAPQ
jgi:septal ring factor EnvC (AmiA/AmiB activator)